MDRRAVNPGVGANCPASAKGKRWITDLDSNLFLSAYRPCRIGPFPGAVSESLTA